MITSAIGRIFLNAYNKKFGTRYDARTFFIEQFYPLFFDAEKYMMTAGNAPLENPKISWADMIIGKKTYETAEKRKDRYDKFLKRIDEVGLDASVARGYPTIDVAATTSGQVSDLSLPLSQDDIFLSWIGDGLGVGVGDLTILFSKKEILLDIFEGWKFYRKFLNETKMLKGNQINVWNGQWLGHIYDNIMYIAKKPMANFNPDFKLSKKNGLMEFVSKSWTQILIAIANKYSETQLMGYVYSLNKTNTTVGFIPFDLTQIKKPIDLYIKYFGIDDRRKAEPLWGTALGFKKACTKGCIGTEAMEPKNLKEIISGKKKMTRAKNKSDKIKLNTYKIWLLAMLNNEELWEKSQELAKLLNKASVDKGDETSTKYKNIVDNLIGAPNKKVFLNTASELLPNIETPETFINIVKEVHFMPTDNVPYFIALVKFQYSSINNNQK